MNTWAMMIISIEIFFIRLYFFFVLLLFSKHFFFENYYFLHPAIEYIFTYLIFIQDDGACGPQSFFFKERKKMRT
jgi:hypothetical protein